MKRKITHSLIAYKCRVCKKYHNDNLLEMTEERPILVDMKGLLIEYIDYIKSCKFDKRNNRAIVLKGNMKKENPSTNIEKYIISVEAGKSGEDFTVVNHNSNARSIFKGVDNSALYDHNVFCFFKETESIFVFHRYGKSGCKTAFNNVFNEFLAGKGLVLHLDVMLSSKMFDGQFRCEPSRISLISTYFNKSTDIADNLSKGGRKKHISKEVIIHLASPEAMNIKNYLLTKFGKKTTMNELKEIALLDNQNTDFDEAMVTVKFGEQSRKISIEQFSGQIADYDITNRLDYYDDEITHKPESFVREVNDYALSLFEDE